MATPPDFTTGQVLTAAQMDAVGLWLVKTQTIGSAVSSVTITNAFTGDYDDYKIIISNTNASNTTDLYFQFVNSGNTVISTDYCLAGFYQVGNTNLNGTYTTTNGNWTIGRLAASQNNSTEFDITAPNLAQYSSTSINAWSSSIAFFNICQHRIATAYPSFKISMGAGTITGGTIRVYGYRK